MLSPQALQEFKEIWKHELGDNISDDFAVEQATSLLALMDVVYKPIRKDLIEYEKGTTQTLYNNTKKHP